MAVDLQLLTKSLRPLPEKFHGLTDQEIRYRQRYVDLIMNQKSRDIFKQRTQIITYIRSFLDSQDFYGSRDSYDAINAGRGYC